MKQSPCYKCPDRTSECHAECEKYAEYAANRNEYLHYQWEKKKTKRDLDDVKAQCIRSCTHGKVKRGAR